MCQKQNIEQLKKEQSVSQRNAKELEDLFVGCKYEAVRFLVDPRKHPSKEAMIEDFMVLLKAIG
jgi:hypothetical protein